ncbi:MAG: transposase [Trichodesmium sp. MAG_R04]|nr:transposase [Trichodesmium sp. MAG_R04]
MVDLIFPSSKTCPNCGHVQDMPLSLRTYYFPDCGLSILLRLKCQYKFKKCGRLDREFLWMSNRRRPQLKQEVNINLSHYVMLCISFIEQIIC